MSRLTGADIEAAIGEVWPWTDKPVLLAEVDWDAVAVLIETRTEARSWWNEKRYSVTDLQRAFADGERFGSGGKP